MSVLPNNTAGSVNTPGVQTYSVLDAIIDPVFGQNLYLYPQLRDIIVQHFPEMDTAWGALTRKLLGETKLVAQTNAAANIVFNVHQDPLSSFSVVEAHAGASGVGPNTVTVTLGAASYVQGYATAPDRYQYMGYSSITNSVFKCFVAEGDVTRTPGAYTLVLTAIEPDVATGVIPAQADGDPIWPLAAVSPEGNTYQSSSGQLIPIYTTEHPLQTMVMEKWATTDRTAFTNASWTPAGSIRLSDGTMVNAKFYWLVGLMEHCKQWMRQIQRNDLFSPGTMVSTDALGLPTYQGLEPFIRTGGNIVQYAAGVFTDTDMLGMIENLRQNWTGVSSYTVIPGVGFQRAFRQWMRSSHFAPQITPITPATDGGIDLDKGYEKFTMEGFTFMVPVDPWSELSNNQGMGGFGYDNVAYVVPSESWMTTAGQRRKLIQWLQMGNAQTQFGGPMGAATSWWKIGAQFRSGAAPGALDILNNSFVVPSEDNEASFGMQCTRGSDFVVPEAFGMWVPL